MLAIELRPGTACSGRLLRVPGSQCDQRGRWVGKKEVEDTGLEMSLASRRN